MLTEMRHSIDELVENVKKIKKTAVKTLDTKILSSLF